MGVRSSLFLYECRNTFCLVGFGLFHQIQSCPANRLIARSQLSKGVRVRNGKHFFFTGIMALKAGDARKSKLYKILCNDEPTLREFSLGQGLRGVHGM